MAMNAEPEDAPDWQLQRRRRARPLALVICLGIGSVTTLVALELAGRARPEPLLTEQGSAHAAAELTTAASGRIERATPLAAEPVSPATPAALREDPRSATPTGRQTVFNDRNFTPRGAYNVLNFSAAHSARPPAAESPQPLKVTVVEQTPSMKDRACWPLKSGSLESRNCRSAVGLNYRD